MKSDFDFSGKSVVVTGASRGIGLGIVRAFASRGADVVLVARDESAVKAVAASIADECSVETLALAADVRDVSSVEAAFETIAEEFGDIDVLVNNAGVANSIAFADLDEESWDRIIDTNLKGVYACCRAGLKRMESGAAIVNIASISGSMVNVPQFQANYNTSKAGVIMLTKSLAVEYAQRGIRVNSLSPGYTLTDMNRRPEVTELVEIWKGRTPMRRLAEVDEIAGPVLFLASPLSSYMTGHDLVVDGGITLLC